MEVGNIYTKKKARISLVVLFLSTIILSLVPVTQTLKKGEYKSVPPAYVDDDIYYYGRMKEVADGYPFISNPYFMEYRDSKPGVFFVADWLAATPLILGIPFSLVIVFNLVFWSLLFVFLAYLLIRAADMPPPLSVGLALVAYCEVYWLIFRPVVMQEVFPFFLFFLLALFWWLRNPLRRSLIWLLIIVSASSFYIYTFLWQIIFATLGIVFIHMFGQKKGLEIKALLWVAFGTCIFSLPAIIYTIYQIQSPFYWETVSRMNMVESYLPSLDAYHYGRWAVILTILYICLQKWFKNNFSGNDFMMKLVIYSGLALIIASISNIFIGKDLSIGQHIGRFITLWIALFLPILLWKLWIYRKETLRLHWLKLSIIGLLSLLCLGFLLLNLKRSLPFQEIATTDITTVQDYAAPLNWLEQREKQSVVIWANSNISMYVPILTKHYVFWAPAGGLFFMPTKEVEDRFLASQIKILTTDEMIASYKTFEGSGVFSRYSDALNKNHLSCLLGRECQPDQNLREWIGTAKLEYLFKRQSKLKEDTSAIVEQYHVSYIIADASKGEDKYFRSLLGAKEVWRNNRFIIYEIK